MLSLLGCGGWICKGGLLKFWNGGAGGGGSYYNELKEEDEREKGEDYKVFIPFKIAINFHR